MAEALGHGNGGLEDQQLGQQSPACRCGLIGRRDRYGQTTDGGSSQQLQGPVLLDFCGCEGGLAFCGWIPLERRQRWGRDPGMSVRRS